MRIDDGKYYATSREGIQKMVDDKSEEIRILKAQLDLVGQFSRQQLNLHQPYVHASDLDVSCAKPSEMKATLAEKLTRNIWCSRCSNPWPCGHIAALRLLRDLSRRWSKMDDIKDLAEQLDRLPEPKKREGQLDIHM